MIYLATDCGGYLCTSSRHALIVTWLNTSQRNQDGDRLDMSEVLKSFISELNVAQKDSVVAG